MSLEIHEPNCYAHCYKHHICLTDRASLEEHYNKFDRVEKD